MIIRIVKMTFRAEEVPTFLTVFHESKQLIRNFEGCSHLELLNDLTNPNIYFTYSYWTSEEALNNYRNSSLFAGVWAQTKVLFSAKTEAWSVEQKVLLP